jgi:hypothetical protein
MATRLLRCFAILALTTATLTLRPSPACAQPSTYDYDADTPGVQGPTFPLFANSFTRFFRPISVNVPVLVPSADLQAALPSGFIAVSDAAGRSTISVLVSFQVTDAEQAPATPYHTLVLLTAVTNTHLNRRETLVLARFNSTQESVDAQNLATGGGVKRADFEWDVGQKGGELSILVAIEAEDGLALHVAARGSAQIDQRVKFDPNPSPFRFVDAGVALGSFRIASLFDQRVVTSNPTNVEVSAKDGRLELPGGGSLTVLGVGPTFIFSKSQEVWLAFE